MAAASNALFILGMDSRGVVLGARQATGAIQGMATATQAAGHQITRAGRGLFNQTAQLSFAFQDIATVMFMGGGIERALLSASNNLAFIASAAGTVKGALIGVGIVLASVIIPRTFDWLRNQEAITREAQKWAQIAANVERGVDRAGDRFDFMQSLQGATPDELRTIIDQQEQRVGRLRTEIEQRASDIERLQGDLEQYGARGLFPFEIGAFPGMREQQGAFGHFFDVVGNVLSLDAHETAYEEWERTVTSELEQVRAAQVDAEKEIAEAMNFRRMAQEALNLGLTEQVDLLKEVRRLSEMRPGLAIRGSQEEAQARLDAARAVFDRQIIDQFESPDPQDDELLRILRELDNGIDQLNAALNRGVSLVPVS